MKHKLVAKCSTCNEPLIVLSKSPLTVRCPRCDLNMLCAQGYGKGDSAFRWEPMPKEQAP